MYATIYDNNTTTGTGANAPVQTQTAVMPAVEPGSTTGPDCGCRQRKEAFVKRAKAIQVLHIIFMILLIMVIWRALFNGNA